ncbi:hypothetical protein L6452_21956 [Arctium lappa]|uniref:Uncharacterized protein n=1 Tax=Arctium lappa TaxID=4217 RepID=A0ACB9B056_ARCLA|nr:hypothetical protein L6452_21956 [Arctium lappa]
MEDSSLVTRDIFPMNKIFVNDVVGSSKTVPAAVINDDDGLRMDSSAEALAGDEEGEDDSNHIVDDSVGATMSRVGGSSSHVDESVCPTSFIKVLVRHLMRLLREIYDLEKEFSQVRREYKELFAKPVVLLGYSQNPNVAILSMGTRWGV